ncbi:MAG: hypothetical protein LBH86_06310, partial [Oscillospiraceae bacterium]|nr:hypothetical protein [Oscillospiraceae bacterium]
NDAIANGADIAFARSTAAWGNITYATLHTAQTGGQLLAYAIRVVRPVSDEFDDAYMALSWEG